VSYLHRNILLTGAAGVLGTALLEELPAVGRVTALIHESPCPTAAEQLAGDLTAPRLGLTDRTYRGLASRVDAVVHCAARTDFTSGPATAQALNHAGTRGVAEFCADAGATLYHVSTAFVARHELTRARLGREAGEAAARPEDYLDSKRAGEDAVRAAGIPAVIIRPSVLIGHSRTGRISAFQGFHGMLSMLLRGLLPLVPFSPATRIDFVPQDAVARAIATLVAADWRSGEVWITAGDHALRADHALDHFAATCRDLGLRPVLPRFVRADMVDRLIRPVFLAGDGGLPASALRRFDDMLAVAALFSDAPVFPVTAVPGGFQPLGRSQLEQALRQSIRYLAAARRRGPELLEMPA
jgi:thioester reductase-like protein